MTKERIDVLRRLIEHGVNEGELPEECRELLAALDESEAKLAAARKLEIKHLRNAARRIKTAMRLEDAEAWAEIAALHSAIIHEIKKCSAALAAKEEGDGG